MGRGRVASGSVCHVCSEAVTAPEWLLEASTCCPVTASLDRPSPSRSLKFYSRMCEISAFIFRSIDPFEFIFMCGVK